MAEAHQIYADDFLKRVEGKRAVASAMVENREHCQEAWHASGMAVEFALKALIMRRERLNCWPGADTHPHLHIHNLRKLFVLAGIDVKLVDKSMRAKLRVVLDWERHHEYPTPQMARKLAREMVNCTFGEEGVVEWLSNQK